MSELPENNHDQGIDGLPFDKLPLEEMAVMQEPPINIDDTPPTGAFRRLDSAPKTDPRATSPIRTPRPTSLLLNWALSGAALVITLAAGFLYLQQTTPPAPQPTSAVPATQSAVIVEATFAPTIEPTLSPTQPPGASIADSNVPLDVVAELLTQPGDTAPPPDRIFRQQTAYTIAPARTRATIMDYVVQPGDTLDKIAARFGISTDTVNWNNDITYVNRLQPGDTLTILPENGIMFKTVGDISIQAIADKYRVSPYVILDSEYNHFQNAKPDFVLPAGVTVIIPGGTSTKKAVYWDPGTSFKKSDPKSPAPSSPGSGASVNPNGEVSFGGGPGSCGYQPNNGNWAPRVPLGAGYQVIRGFFPGHSGIDLAAPTGTTVFAASNGTVIFAGWSNWGYGNSIVITHGGANILTLYGHLSRINVSCGQAVSVGQPIGAVGTTGNSTGPHLHFEIRPGGEPANPVGFMAF